MPDLPDNEINLGDTFLIQDYDSPNFHLHIVISDPSSNTGGFMLLPCIETLKKHHKDFSCILKIGDHPFFDRESIVEYRRTKKMTTPQLNRMIMDGIARKREPLALDVLKRVIEGAKVTKFLSPDKKKLLS